MNLSVGVSTALNAAVSWPAVLLSILILIAPAGPVSAGPEWSINLVIDADQALVGQQATVSAHCPNSEEELRKSIELPWQGEFRLTMDCPWRFRLDCDRCWAPVVQWEGGSLLSMRVVLAGVLVGQAHLAGDAIPGAVVVEGQDRNGERFEAHCPVAGTRFRCVLPTGQVDIRIHAEEAVSRSFWGLEISQREPADLGAVLLTTGSTLVGWVDASDRGKIPGATVLLAPERIALPVDPKQGERLELEAHETSAQPSGSFRFEGLLPGTYSLSARQGDWAAGPISITIPEMGEGTGPVVDLPKQNLELLPPPRISLTLEPGVDPWGEPWVIHLSALDKAGRLEPLARSPATLGGAWESPPLSVRGHFVLAVHDSRESRWWREEVEVADHSPDLFRALDVVEVRGTLRWGGEPIRGTLFFGGTRGERSIPIETEDDGDFEGSLPSEGLWRIDVQLDGVELAVDPVEIERRPGASYARADIELPATRLHGRVIFEGDPLEAKLLGVREGPSSGDGRQRRRELRAETDEEGRFEILGLAEGQFKIQARATGLASEWQMVELHEGLDSTELVLELRQKIDWRGVVHGPGGAIVGARILAYPALGMGRETESGPSGSFGLKLLSGTPFVDLVLIPPGAGFDFHRAVVRPGEPRDDLVPPVAESRIELDQEGGDLVLIPHEDFGLGFLARAGVVVELATLLPALSRASRLGDPTQPGIRILGVGLGRWHYCQDSGLRSCTEGEVFPAAVTTLKLADTIQSR